MNIRIHQAVLAALAVGVAGSAAAIDISTVPTANVVYASGSTAIDAALKAYFFNSVDSTTPCDSTKGTIDVYNQGSGAASKFTAVACVSNSALVNDGASPPNSVNIAIIKEDNAGSLNGVTALQNIAFSGSPYTDGRLNFPTISQLTTSNCSASTAVAGTTSNNLQSYTKHTCTGFTAAAITPQLGFADVEGTLFPTTDPTTPVALASGPTVQVVFAPAVSLGLYHALQYVEGLTQDDLVADMPSLTTAQLSALYSGQVGSGGWSWLKSADGTKSVGTASVAFGISNTAQCWTGTSTGTSCTTPGVSAPANTNVYICRRGRNSGTEVASEIYFNDANCAAGAYPFKAISSGTCATATTDGCTWSQAWVSSKSVFAGNGTGDLLDCLNGHDAAGLFAIGFASVDNLSGSDQSTANRRDFRYIKVNGVVPSIENAAAGKYAYLAQSFWYAPPSSVAWSAANASGAVANALVTVMTTNSTQALGTIGSVAGVNAASKMADQGFDGGVLVIPGNNGAAPVTGASTAFASTPVSTVTKTSSSSTTNNCVRPVTYNLASETTAGSPTWAP